MYDLFWGLCSIMKNHWRYWKSLPLLVVSPCIIRCDHCDWCMIPVFSMTDSTAMETSSVRNSPRLSPMLGRLRSAVLATLATSRTLLTTATQRWLVRVARLCGHPYFAQPSVCLCLTIVANMCQRGQNKIIVFRFSEIIQIWCICFKKVDIYCTVDIIKKQAIVNNPRQYV